MEHYATYSREDFLRDDAFVDWIRQPSEAKNRYWEQVLAAHPYQRETIRQARKLVEKLASFYPEVPEEDVTVVWNGINQRLESEDTRIIPLWSQISKWVPWVAAATVVLGLGIGWLLLQDQKKK